MYKQGNQGLPGSERQYIENELRKVGAELNQLTNGLTYVQMETVAGLPGFTPTLVDGRAPLVWNSGDNKLYAYSAGAWHAV